MHYNQLHSPAGLAGGHCGEGDDAVVLGEGGEGQGGAQAREDGGEACEGGVEVRR